MENITDTKAKQDGVLVISDLVSADAKWYVVHTYSGHENKVAVSLKERALLGDFTDRIFKVFVPQQQKIVISEGKKRTSTERLFPGYIMVQMVLSDDSWHLVRSTHGVTGFVGTGTTPTPISENEVKTLMRFVQMETPKFEAKFSVGDPVKITSGPFRDTMGKISEINEDQGKVKVLISSFGREVPMELDLIQVSTI